MFDLERQSISNSKVEEEGDKESIDDVLQSYGILPRDEQPPPKRLCLTTMTLQQKKTIDVNEIRENKSPPRRNPFHVKSIAPVPIQEQSPDSNTLKSPIKLTSENSSLLRQISPVKKIEYDSRPTLQVRSKTEKLSRFKRTVIACDGQKVISRFFSVSSSAQVTTTVSNPPESSSANESEPMVQDPYQEETGSPTQTANIYLLSPEARGEKTPKKQRPSLHSGDSCSPAPPVKGERSVEKLDSGFVEEPEEGLSSSQKENQSEQVKSTSRLSLFSKKEPMRLSAEKVDITEEDVIEIKDDEEQDSSQDLSVESKPATIIGRTSSGSSQKKATCRRVGLSKNKSLKGVGPNQSKLSMFGFQKKVQLK